MSAGLDPSPTPADSDTRPEAGAAGAAADAEGPTGPEDDGVGAPDGPDDADGRWPRGAVLGAACVLALAVGVFLAASRDQGQTRTADPDPAITPGDTLPAGHPSLDDSDQFEALTLEELETEVADESAPVALRLTLAERYLATGDIELARDQARIARAQAGTDVEQQRALRDLGWALALLGRPVRGAALLEEALAIAPGERNAMWYLANVRLAGLDDPDGAAELFAELLAAEDLSAEQRTAVEERLAAARAAAGD